MAGGCHRLWIYFVAGERRDTTMMTTTADITADTTVHYDRYMIDSTEGEKVPLILRAVLLCVCTIILQNLKKVRKETHIEAL